MDHIGFPLETVLIFVVVVAFSIYVDLVLHRNAHEISVRDAGLWSLFWISLSLGFYGYLHVRYGSHIASLFLSGYVLEKSLSVDNLMVFIAIFGFYKIAGPLQHRILYYGIMGAIGFRLLFVALGGIILQLGPWADLVFAALVGWAAVKMLKGGEEESVDWDEDRVVRWARRMFPVVSQLHGKRFFVARSEVESHAKANNVAMPTRQAARYATPAFVVLCLIEGSDVMFSMDSVPAVIAVTREPLLVYAAMIFAILGLRSLYFILAALSKYLIHLGKAVVVLLFFIAGKLVLHATHEFHLHQFDISPNQNLLIIGGVLAIGVLASLVFPGKEDLETVG